MEKTVKWWQKEVTWGFFIKFMVTLNFLALAICFRFAYIGDLIDEDQQEYYQYLEERVEVQSKLIKTYEILLYDKGLEELTKSY